jgi:acetyl esterase/lipase
MTIADWLVGLAVGIALAATPASPERFAYGPAPSQFGELWLPDADGRAPVVVMVHGGCWQRSYGLDLMHPLAADLRDHGIAVWNIEYRRLGEPGGGYPGTFADTAAAIDALRGLATKYPLDLGHVLALGHSAGGQLSLWAAARPRLPARSMLRRTNPLPIGSVVTLAGINDLAAYRATGPACGGAATIDALIGAAARRGQDPYADTSPRAMLPLGVAQAIVSGTEDGIVPAQFGRDYAKAAEAAGDPATAIELPDADHFTLIDPSSAAWREIRRRVLGLLGGR